MEIKCSVKLKMKKKFYYLSAWVLYEPCCKWQKQFRGNTCYFCKYIIGQQRRLRRACVNTQTCLSLYCSHTQRIDEQCRWRLRTKSRPVARRFHQHGRLQDAFFAFAISIQKSKPKVHVLAHLLKCKFSLTHISLLSFCGTSAHSVNPDQTPHQALHCLFTEISFKIWKMETLKLEIIYSSNWQGWEKQSA